MKNNILYNSKFNSLDQRIKRIYIDKFINFSEVNSNIKIIQ